jgi:hypothetical protein
MHLVVEPLTLEPPPVGPLIDPFAFDVVVNEVDQRKQPWPCFLPST